MRRSEAARAFCFLTYLLTGHLLMVPYLLTYLLYLLTDLLETPQRPLRFDLPPHQPPTSTQRVHHPLNSLRSTLPLRPMRFLHWHTCILAYLHICTRSQAHALLALRETLGTGAELSSANVAVGCGCVLSTSALHVPSVLCMCHACVTHLACLCPRISQVRW